MVTCNMVDKLIVTNHAALRRKYGARGLAKVTAAVKALIAADRKRGLMTRLIALDSAAMKPVRRATSCAAVTARPMRMRRYSASSAATSNATASLCRTF
jgi:hypothetical protein